MLTKITPNGSVWTTIDLSSLQTIISYIDM